MDFGITSVAAITVICYLIGLIVKASGLDNKYVPAIMGLGGEFLGISGLYFVTDNFVASTER